jgi:hypothetical protein
MTRKLLKKSKRFRDNAGIALLTTILLLFLMSSLLVGFAVLLVSNQQLAGANNDQVVAFYAAEAGMEKMTADLGALFAITYSPNISQIDGLETTPYGPPISSIFPGESVAYTTADGTPAYTITPAAVDANGNPAPTITTIKGGPYQGMTAMATEYTLNVNARTNSGREVNLIRTTQTVGIPMFQFGIFGNTDLDFFPGPPFNFGGRTHTNGNLWLAANSGPLTLSSKVDAWKDVIRQRLENGYQLNGGNYTGTVDVTTTGTTGTYRALGQAEGSLVMSVEPYDSPSCTTTWQTISQVDYNSNLINGKGSACPQYSTGANQLNLAVVTMGGGTTQSIDLIRRPVVGEAANVTNERYFSQASLRILLSDNPADITNLPCVSAGAPFDLSWLATPPGAAGANWLASGNATLVKIATTMIANGVPLIPLPASGATGGAVYSSTDGYWMPVSTTTPGNPNFFPIVKGYIKIDAQVAPYPTTGCTSADETDVTAEILALGYIGRNINPVPQSLNGTAMDPQWQYVAGGNMQAGVAPAIPSLSWATLGAALGYQNTTTTPGAATAAFAAASVSTTANPTACPEPHPNAVIRLARIRDNPSSVYYNTGKLSTTKPTNYPFQSTVGEVCGVATPGVLAQTRSGVSTGGVYGTASTWTPQVYDTWNNTLFDAREGTLRDESMSTSMLPTLNGTMHYIEVDAHNVARWFGGAIGTSGGSTKDPVVAPDNFLVYISDRRGNYDNSAPLASWPPIPQPGSFETGEYGWNDLTNSATDQNGCPDNALETGEDPDQVSQLYTYGANGKYIHGAGLGLTAATLLSYGQYGIFSGLGGATAASAVTTSTIPCTTIPTYSNAANSDSIWPMMVSSVVDAVRENPPLFFRRAVKIVNGSDLTPVGACPGGVNCGLAIAVENPVYIQGDYNANVGGAGWGSTEIASSVAGDAVTLLSDQWNEINSFVLPYCISTTAVPGCPVVARNGITTYYRTAIVAGATVPFTQPTFGGVSDDYGTDGGVHNFLRYIEDWAGTLEYNGSIVDLYYSRQANGTFKCCNTVYSPPTRGYNFDTNFLNPTLLPPRTPLFRTVSTTGWTRVLAPQNGIYK